MLRRLQGDLAYYQFESILGGGVAHGIFTRHGGVSGEPYASLNLSRSTGDAAESVTENRRRVYHTLGIDPARAITSWLVHGNDVRIITASTLDELGRDDVHADGMVTREPGVTLTMRYADCLPILLHDPARGAIGIAHAGWQGIVRDIIAATVDAMRVGFGCAPGNIRAGIGPGIGPARFEVSPDVAERIQASVAEPVILRAEGGRLKPHVDLWRAARAQLLSAGVHHIEESGLCTASRTEDWFSHRAEHGRTGRFGVAIALAP